MIINEQTLNLAFIKCEELLNQNNDELIDLLIDISNSPFSKGTSEFKMFVIDLFSNTPELMLMFVNKWNETSPGKMIPNSIRRAFKYLIEHQYSFETLDNLNSYKNISIKNIIRLTRPKPYPLKISDEIAEEMYNSGYTLYKNETPINKDILSLDFSQLGSGPFYHFDCFVLLLNK